MELKLEVVSVVYLYQKSKALRMCVEALVKSAIRHKQVLVHRIRHKANRLVACALKLFSLAVCMCLSPQFVCEKWRSRLYLDQHRKVAFQRGEPHNAQGNSGKSQKHEGTCVHRCIATYDLISHSTIKEAR